MKKELWLRLHHYRFEDLVPAHLADRVASVFGGTDASTHAFAAKLARKQRWTTSFALRAIAEYKKFVYLGNVSDFSVTPPKVIDAVWHEHLLFSRAYRDFCRDVLGRDFDHHPELLPAHDQTEAFQAQYTATLALYLAEFNAAPPADVWGTPKFGKPEGAKAKPERKRDAVTMGTVYPDDAPLFTYFDGASSGDSHSAGDSGFGGGGGFSGGGGGSDWSGDSSSGDASSSDASGSSDGGGSSCSGGSGCSSSCGGE